MIRSITFCVNRRLLFSIFYVFVLTAFSFAQNAIVTENANAGNPNSEWGVPDFRDNRIAGYATKMSLNRGQTVHFKINVQSGASYTIKIYRIGYYGGNGGRLMQNLGTFTGTIQPNGITNSTTGMLDCSNWSESASWAIPSGAVSGLYIAKLERTGGGSNHIVFIVRNDASTSDLYFQFPDATWQAYNGYGGTSNYDGTTSWPSGHAVKVSYNRPFFPYNSLFNTDGREADWYMNSEYPMIRWLERNGYDVTYTSCNDVDNNGGRLLNHKIFISNGHDEYWSKGQRNNVEAARNAGVNLAFFSGNEVYWKTRWESNDGTEDRTLVCYKEGTMADGTINERACGSKCDGSTSEWTGLWRMGGNYDGGKPENALTGQISWVEYPSEIEVPAFYKKIRFWRNSSVANLSAGQTAALGINTLGYEWDYEQPLFASSNAPGRITMSSKTVNSLTHKLSLYRHSSGALVFGAGTVQWSWGLDGNHWGGSTTTSTEMQQATVNLFADMGVQPGTLQSGLSSATKSTDATLPTSSITSPSNGSSVTVGASVTFSGTAADAGGGVVAAVEVSTDGGSTWSQATVSAIDGNITWSYTWTAGPNGTYTIRSRGVDDSGNIGTATGITLIVGTGGGDITAPTVSSVSPSSGSTGVSIGTNVIANFSEAVNSSTVTSSTFQLRDAGSNLVSATVSTSSNQITLTPSVALNNSTIYTVTIKGGASGVKDLAGNALVNDYTWSFTTVANADNTPPTVSSVSPVNGATDVYIYTNVTGSFNEAINASTVTSSTFQLKDPGNNIVSATVGTSSNQITLTPTAALAISTTYTVTIFGGASGVKDLAGNALASDYSWSFTTGTVTTPPPVTIQSVTTKTGTAALAHSLTGVPAGALLVLATTADAAPSNCNVSSSPSLTWTKRADAGATSSDNAEVWTAVYSAGGSITVTSNWGDASQSSVCYVVLNAEATLGGASATGVSQAAPSVLLTTTRDNSIIFGCTADWKAINGATRTLRDAATERLYFKDGNYTTYHYTKTAASIGAYTEGVSVPTGQQSSTALLEIRSIAAAPDITPPTVSSVAPVNGATGVLISTTTSVTFSEAMDAITINNSTIELRNSSSVLIAATVSYNAGTKTATVTPSAALDNSTVYTATVKSGASGVKDVAGNALASDYIWSFTTGDFIPPTVSSVTPVNGTTGVLVSTTVSATFNEAMNASTINSSTIELRNPSNALITATVSYNAGTKTVTVTPSVALDNSTVYTATVKSGASGVKDVAGNALASDYSWSFTTGDFIPPTVSSVAPVNGATGVLVSTTVSAIFNEAMDASTINNSTIELRNASNALIAATISYNAGTKTATVTPSVALDNSTVYTAMVKSGASGVKDVAGNALASDYIWSFTTGDFIPPTVSSVTPVNGTTGVLVSTTVSATFNEAMNASTINSSTIELRNPSNALITATVSYNAGTKTVTVTPSVALDNSTVYTATVKSGASGVKDVAGNALASDYSWSFTTGDFTPPTVLSVTPVNGATGVVVNTTVSATFSEAMDASTINGSTIELRNSANTLITATVSYNAGTKTATVTPSVALDNSTVYTAMIKSGTPGVKDVAGNALVSDYSWSFTTGDFIPPTIVSATPANGAIGVVVNTTASATFNEAMDAATINSSTIELRNSSNALITATVSYNAGTKTATVTPSSSLVNSTVYTVTIKGGASGVKDVAGNALAIDYSWSFTTEADIIPPTVSSVTPVNAATGVFVATTASAFFDEAMDATTINNSTIELRNSSSILITAAVSYNVGTRTVTLTPSSSLANSTVYTVTIKGGSSGVKDIAGNALAIDYSWSFTTEVGDIVPPTVSSVSPVDGATEISIGTTASAIFDEALDATTINSSTIELRNASNVLITAAVSYNAGTKTATVTPSALLANSTVYTVTIKGSTSGVKDVAGNALTSDYNWSFTTVAADITPPTVSSVMPVNGATGVSISTNASTLFSEAMDATTINSSTIELRNASNVLITAIVSYNAGTRTATVTPSASLVNSTVYTITIKGGVAGVKDVAGNALAIDFNWSFTTVAGDITPPTVSSVAPVNGAIGVPISTTASAIFNEAMDATTVNSSTIEVRNASNVLIATTVSYNAGTGTATLTPSALLVNSTVYTVTIKGGASGVKDIAGNALASDYNWSFTTVAGDITPPTVSSVTPVNGATGISIGTTASAIFNEAMNAGTINSSTIELRNASNVLIATTISYNAGTSTATVTPTSALTASTTYTVTIAGGASGVKDLAGNALANNYSWSFTTAVGSTTYTLFLSSDTPAVPLAHDGQGIELGMRFRSTQDGFINGIRYYKGSGTTGTHMGSLWNNAGTTRLAQATFTSETSSGWQQVLFSSPVAITAGVTYVASFFSPSGDYSATKPYFTQNIINGPLIGLADGTDGANGLYRYTATSAFPNSTFQSSNYWVDVVFAPGSDNIAPTVSSVSPVNGATAISIGTTVTATFSEAVNSSTVTTSTFQLRDAGNNLVSATVSTSSNQITLTPLSVLSNSTVYTATITGGASGVKDPSGNALASNYSWSFTTASVDNTPPAVTTVSPASGATGVGTGGSVTTTFSEAINSSTVTTGTFQLRDASNNLVSATVSTSSNQITLTPSSALNSSTVYTATITGGVSGVKDLSGNVLVNNYSWSFTTGNVTAPPPVTIQSSDTKTGTAATVHSLTGVPAGALLVLATTADVAPTNCNVSSSPSLTWTKRVDAGASSSDNAEIWTAVYSAGGSITVTSNWGTGKSQASVCYVVLNAETTLGGASAIATLQSAPSVTLTTTRDNSIIFGCTADWKAINGATRTLRDAATERLYFRDGNYTTYHYTKTAATTAAYTEGVSLPTGQQSSTALLEIRSASSVATRSANPAHTVNNAITSADSPVYSHSLGQNYPNPFNGVTNIPFTLSNTEKVNLILFDVSGRVVKVLVNASKDAGIHAVKFNAGSLAKGIYYYRIQAGDFTDVKKLIIW